MSIESLEFIKYNPRFLMRNGDFFLILSVWNPFGRIDSERPENTTLGKSHFPNLQIFNSLSLYLSDPEDRAFCIGFCPAARGVDL